VKATAKFHLLASSARTAFAQRVRRVWQSQRGDITSTVIIIAVLAAAAIAAGVVITSFISDQTSKIS